MRMNGLVAPATIRLAKLRGGWVPTGIVETMEDAATTSGGRCVVARPPETIVRPPFEERAQGPAAPGARDRHRDPTPRGGRAPAGPRAREVPGCHHRPGRPPLGAVALLRRRGPHASTRLQQPLPGRPERGRRSSGRPGLPRRRELLPLPHRRAPAAGRARAGPRRAAPDLWYVPAQARWRELLDLAGITTTLRIDSDQYPHVRAETLVVPGLASVVKEKNPPWVVAFLRRRLMQQITPPKALRPLYVTRTAGTHNRTVVNEAALIRLLTARGFEVIDPAEEGVTAQMEAFASASVIVSGARRGVGEPGLRQSGRDGDRVVSGWPSAPRLLAAREQRRRALSLPLRLAGGQQPQPEHRHRERHRGRPGCARGHARRRCSPMTGRPHRPGFPVVASLLEG